MLSRVQKSGTADTFSTAGSVLSDHWKHVKAHENARLGSEASRDFALGIFGSRTEGLSKPPPTPKFSQTAAISQPQLPDVVTVREVSLRRRSRKEMDRRMTLEQLALVHLSPVSCAQFHVLHQS